MNIVFATSDLYSRPAVITIKSLLMNNTDAEEINIFYVENGISDKNKKIITDLVREYGRNVEFIPMPENLNGVSGLVRTNVIAYTYCYFQDILPESVEKVILLEADTIVTDSMAEMYSIDIDDCYLGVVDDLQSRECKKRIGISPDSPYFNSGVMIMNLKKMREDNITDKITKLIESGTAKFMYEVQDEMNVLFEGRVRMIHPKFNCTTALFLFSYRNMKKYRHPTTCCTEEEFNEAKSHPVVVHFTKNQIIQSRPWVEGCTHPFNDYYLKIKEDTCLKDEPLWKSDRKKSNKIVHFMYSKISKTMVAATLGVIHAYLYPKVLYKHMLK